VCATVEPVTIGVDLSLWRVTVAHPAAAARLVIVVALLTLACGATSHGGPLTASSPAADPSVAPASNLADMRGRPLHLPALGSNQACPITPSHDLAPVVNGEKSKGPGFGFGPGPAYLSGIVQIYPGGFDNEIWLIEPTYDGPVLVRGQRINGNGLVEFEEPITFRTGDGLSSGGSPPPGPPVRSVTIGGSSTPFYQELDLPAKTATDAAGFWRMFFARTHIETPGCYAFQLDGVRFSQVIVFQVPDAARPAA
jgi:hypothetical protein